MKTPKPGQLCTINGVIYRAKKRSKGCRGCALDDYTLCPNIVDSRSDGSRPLNCGINNIILVRV